jgi:hypothetical protein
MTSIRDRWDPDEREALESISREVDEIQERHAADPSVDLLRAAHAGALPSELQDDISAHLRDNRWSRTLVESLEDTGAELTSADEDRLLRRIQQTASVEAGDRRTRIAWLALPAFAAIAILVIGAATWKMFTGPGPSSKPASTTADRPVPLPSPEPAFSIPLEKAEVRLTPAALTWRVPGQNTFVDDVKPAMDAYRSGEYRQSAEAFSALASKYPQSVEVFFYQGVSRLLLADARGAHDALIRAERVAEGSFVDDSAWYLAIADERLGDVGAARTRLERLCRGTGPRSAAACAAQKKIDERDSRRR